MKPYFDERREVRRKLNGTPYPDNPHNLPYDNQGNLLTKEQYKKKLQK